jgi:hypothetical protein
MYGAEFVDKHASWFGLDDHLYQADNGDETTIEPYTNLSDSVVQSLIARRPREAAIHLEKQLLQDQTNMLALRIAHDLHKRNGSVGPLGGSIPRVLPFWDGNRAAYRALLGLHAASLTETSKWEAAEEAGMRALSDLNMPQPGEGPSHDVVAVNALCDLLYLCGRSREGLRFLREISIERGPDRHDGGLDAAIACARTVFYIDVGSRDLALHQLDMAMSDVPTLTLDGLTRLTSATWRAHCAYFALENDNEDAVRPMWSRLWAQWRRYGENEKDNTREGGVDGDRSNTSLLPLEFGPVHAALATLVYGRLTSSLITTTEDEEDEEDEEEEVDEETSAKEVQKDRDMSDDDIDNDVLNMWTFDDGEETIEEGRLLLSSNRNTAHSNLCRGLLASARGQDKKAIDCLVPYEYELRQCLGGESIHHDAIVRGLPRHCMNGGQPVRARAMLSERSFMRPGSPLIWDEYSRALTMSGETMAAQMADDHAINLGFGQGGFGAH